MTDSQGCCDGKQKSLDEIKNNVGHFHESELRSVSEEFHISENFKMRNLVFLKTLDISWNVEMLRQ